MSDYLVYWKDFWSDVAGYPSAPIAFEWHTAKESFFRDVEENDSLWVVVTGGKNHPHEWRLLKRLVVRSKQINRYGPRPFEILGNDAASEEFDITNQSDFEPQLKKLHFASGKKITVSGAAIGKALQAIRLLAPSDVALVREYSLSIDKRLTQPDGFYEPRSGPALPRSSLTEFFRQASFYRDHPKFQEYEREYKIQLSNALKRSRELLPTSSSQALKALIKAIKSKDDNIIDWRDRKVFLDWLQERPERAAQSVDLLWDESDHLNRRFSSFADRLSESGLEKPGAQLAVTSTLLMALGAETFPPVKVDSFYKAMRLAGWESLYKIKGAFDRYRNAQVFMDTMIAESEKFQVTLNDRLDVQGVVWCVSGGWKNLAVPDDWINDPAQRVSNERSEYVKELLDLDAEPGSSDLTITEKLALVKARRGQGKFREELVGYWDCCALTACSELSLLIASHIKPWKMSDTNERLDPYNGLLLSPNLDSAFDKGLITFDDSGRIHISKSLTSADRKVLGIHSKLKLRKLSPKHVSYLRYHRESKFADRVKA